MQDQGIPSSIVSKEPIFDAFFNLDEQIANPKTHSLALTQTGSFLQADHVAVARGKGRPKGEKNSKNPYKRSKPVLGEENQRKGHWSSEENKKYHWFLEVYSNHFICKEMRRLDKIFKTMALFIGSREAEQCRSHHQKMEKKYNCFTNIILYLRNFHYSSEDTYLLEQDLMRNQITKTNTLISAKQLKNAQFSSNKQEGASGSEQAKVDGGAEDNEKEELYLDFLGEDYQRRLDIDDLLF